MVKSNISDLFKILFLIITIGILCINNSATNAYLGIYEDAPNIDNYNLKRDPNSLILVAF